MKKIFQIIYILLFSSLAADDHNLIMIIDNLQQETAKTQEVNMTHQTITALQQRAAMVLASTTLWKNIIDRKKEFTKKLEDSKSLASKMFEFYQTTNKKIKVENYDLARVNQQLSQQWYQSTYPELAQLEQGDLDQLKFNFLCYIFEFDIDQWHIYNAHAGMLLFVPREIHCNIDKSYEVLQENDLVKHIDKKSHPVESLQSLFKNSCDRWVIYLSGHGHPKSSQQGANIAGLKIDEFEKLIHYCNDEMKIYLFVYSSCYGGGVHTVEPYMDVKLHYPVIVIALTDAPIYGFGLFEGFKLPPYNNDFKLQATDIRYDYGLLPYAMQRYDLFFKQAWGGQFDMNMIQYLSQFFMCDVSQCHVQKIENLPLIRQSQATFFTPMSDAKVVDFVQYATTDRVITLPKPILLYTKKVKKIELDFAVPIISMLPGMQSHEIGELVAPKISLSEIFSSIFLSLPDMQAYKNFMIKKVICFNDLIGTQGAAQLHQFLFLGQQNLMPKFLDVQAQAVIYCKYRNKCYLIVWTDQKITRVMTLTTQQIFVMSEIEKLVKKSINYNSDLFSHNLLSHEAYIENKAHHENLMNTCVRAKICKKV